jgi:hypothetical protein
LEEKVCNGHPKSTKITIFFTTIGPRDLEFDPIWLCDMPKCSVDTDGHILGIIGPNWEKKFAPDTINPPKSPYFLPQLLLYRTYIALNSCI